MEPIGCDVNQSPLPQLPLITDRFGILIKANIVSLLTVVKSVKRTIRCSARIGYDGKKRERKVNAAHETDIREILSSKLVHISLLAN